MAETGLIGGGVSGHLRLLLNVRWDDVGPSTTVSNVYADWYNQSQAWGYNDSQRINFGGSLGGFWDFTMSSGTGATVTQFLGTYNIGAHGTSYGGGPSWTLSASISGAYDGSAPSLAYVFTLPARPASVPNAPTLGITEVSASSSRIRVFAGANNGSSISSYRTEVDDSPGFGSLYGFTGETDFYTPGLAPVTTYYARTRATNGVGTSAWSATYSFTTGASVPAAPTAVAVSAITPTSGSIAWTAGFNGGSAILGTTIHLSPDPGFASGLLTFTDTDGSPYAITSLSPGTKYYYRVRSYNGVGASLWSTVGSFTTLLGTPTVINPVAGSIQPYGYPLGTVYAPGLATNGTILFQTSQDITFATGVISASFNPIKTANDLYNFSQPFSYLKTGTWYARARVSTTGVGAYTTDWSATVEYIESHQPSTATVAPSAGSVTEWTATTTFSFKFIDSAVFSSSSPEKISAYQIQVEKNVDATSVWDSGKVAHVSSFETIIIFHGISSTLKNQQLRWRVKVWDTGDTESAWTGWTIFTLADRPIVNFTEPGDGVSVDNGSPAFAWEFSSLNGAPQVSGVVTVTDVADSHVVWEQIVLGGTTLVQPDQVILLNEHDYIATLTVTDAFGLVGTDSMNFSASYIAPDPIYYSADAEDADTLGYIEVSWVDAIPDPEFIAWKVYRKLESETSWTLVEYIPDQNQRIYYDFLLVAGLTYMYSVTQVANRSGAALESGVGYYNAPAVGGGFILTVEDRTYYADLTTYWIINSDNPALSTMLVNVISDDSQLQFEQAVYPIVGRGRHVDYGDRLGYMGTLVCQVRGAERPSLFRLKMEALRTAQETYHLRTPFGRIFQVALGDLSWSPLPGTGTSEMGTLTIPYMEVA